MIREINDKIIKLQKKRLIVQILSLVFWVLSFKISADSINYVMPMAELTIAMANNYIEIDSLYSDLILFFMNFVYRNLPFIVYVGGRGCVHIISREIRKLESDKRNIIENEKKQRELNKKINFEDVVRICDIVNRFEELPRNKQMEVLNCIKGELTKQHNDLIESIDLLTDDAKDLLQTECEDILFPDFDESEKDYSKKREL